jgi:chaperonin cofactor prefoldin
MKQLSKLKMKTNMKLKEKLLAHCKNEVESQISNAKTAMDASQKTANEETKSTVGDKYETTRAMMHIQKDNYAAQLATALNCKKELSKIDISEKSRVQGGAVVITSVGSFFIASSSEDIEIDDEEYTPISIESPIGAALKGLCKNESADFRGRKIDVMDVF